MADAEESPQITSAAVNGAHRSPASRKLNRNTVLNALRRKDLGPLLVLYASVRDAMPANERERLTWRHLAATMAADGQPVLLKMQSPQFTRLFGANARPLARPSSHPNAKSKRTPDTWTDLERLTLHLCDGQGSSDTTTASRHSFYHAWLTKALSGHQQQQSMRSIVAGTYLLFRPSVAFPGRYVIGLLVIYVTSDNAVATYELNRLLTSDDQRPESGRDEPGPLNIVEEHHGYAVRKSGTLLIRSWEESSGEEQAGIFSLLNDDDKKYTHIIDGHYLGVLSTSGPTSRPVVLLRQGDCPALPLSRDDLKAFLVSDTLRELQRHVGIVEWQQLPALVRARLSRAAGSMAIYDVPRAPD